MQTHRKSKATTRFKLNERAEKIIVIVVLILICLAVMLYGQASGLGAPQCFTGVAC